MKALEWASAPGVQLDLFIGGDNAFGATLEDGYALLFSVSGPRIRAGDPCLDEKSVATLLWANSAIARQTIGAPTNIPSVAAVPPLCRARHGSGKDLGVPGGQHPNADGFGGEVFGLVGA